MYQSFTAPADGIYEIKFYAVTSSTSGRGFQNIFGDNIAQAYATAGSNKAKVAMTVIDQTGCTLVADANIRTLSIEAAEGAIIEYGLENIATGGNWYTIKSLSAKMKTVAEIFQGQYDEAYTIWENSTENVEGARATFKTYVDALHDAMSGTLAEAQVASDQLAAALVTYENSSYPVKGKGVKYDFTSKMNMAINAWTCKQGNGPAQYGFTGATETYGNTNAGEVMYQTISGLANGEYEIHFYAVANAANGGGTAGSGMTYVYANDQKQDISVIQQSQCTPSDYERTITVMVKDGTIKYGITNTAAAGNWYICKNVALYMTGAPDLSDYYEVIAENLTTANGLKASKMNATVASALQAAIDATDGYESITVVRTLETLSENLLKVIADANTSIANYAEALNVLQVADALDAAGKAAYVANADVAALQSAYDNGTFEAMTAEQTAACAAAYVAAVKSQTTVGSNWTDVIANPSFESGFNGWTNNGMSVQGNNSFEKVGNNYVECWEPNGTKSISQTLQAIPFGLYRLSAKVKARGVTSAKIFAAGVNKEITIEDAVSTVSVEFACENNADVTIGFEGTGTGASSSWLCVDNFTLTLVGTTLPDVTAVEGKMNAIVAQAQTEAIATYNESKTIANYNAAVAAVAAAQASIDVYVIANNALQKANNILDNNNIFTEDALATFQAILGPAQTAYDESTMTNEDVTTFVNQVYGTGWHSTAAVDDLLISAWDVAARNWSSYHVNTWSTVDDSGNPNFVAPCIEYWTNDDATLADKVLTATLPNFVPGASYKVTATVCLGVNTGVDASTNPAGIVLQLNDGSAISVCTGSRINETRFYEGTFVAEGMIGLDGKLNVKFNVEGTNVSWMTFRNVKFEKTADAAAATAEEIAALNTAISNAEAKTLGFEAGEYAPYNNVAALEALAAAKAIDATTASGYAVVAATTALTAATWTANTAEVNAIYGGDFTKYETISGEDMPYGWNLYNGETNHSRIMGGSEGAANEGLSATTSGKALLMKFNATYGESEGYTMPLKAGKMYKITFKHGRWNEAHPRLTDVVMTDPNGSSITLAPAFQAKNNNSEATAENWETYTGYFVSTTAGNYNLNFIKQGGNTQMQIAIADIDLRSTAEALEFADGSVVPTYAPGTYPAVKITRTLTAGRWATAVYPFAVSGVDKIAVLDSYNKETGELAFKNAFSSEANVPFLMRSTAGATEISLSNVEVAAAVATDATANEASLKGTYTSIDITNAEKNYVLSDNAIYSVGVDGATINPYRAYIQVAQDAPSRALRFVVDGEQTTAIEGIDAENAENGLVYNLNGQRVVKAQKGLYIVNGKKMVKK